MQKKLIHERIQTISPDVFTCSNIDSLILWLSNIKDEFVESVESGYVEVGMMVNIWCHEDDIDMHFTGSRYETDEEFADRKKRSDAAKAAAKKRQEKLDQKKLEKEDLERQEYIRLKAKFGDSV